LLLVAGAGGHQGECDNQQFSQSDHGLPPQKNLGGRRLPASSTRNIIGTKKRIETH
jgi:hypothetical protein